MAASKKIGILGGTFNPIHNGHLMIAENAYRDFYLDEVWLMPAAIPPHKRKLHILADEMRLEMVRLAALDVPYFKASDFEIKKGTISYTSQTLTQLKEEHPENTYYFIMGADSLRDFATWHRPDIILAAAHILAAARDDIDDERLYGYIHEINARYNGQVDLLHVPRLDISSTMIRERAGMQKSVRYFVPDAVAEYISQNRLYMN